MTGMAIQALGLLAGGIVTAAAAPRVIDIIRNIETAKGESYSRNAMMIVGNLLWVGYGALSSAPAVMIMCGLNTALIGSILWAAIRANRRL